MFTTTFYSFKGGVGRMLALMNVAFELVSRGNKVTVIDFDLEAPGMQTFDVFEGIFNEDGKLKVKGIADFVSDYRISCNSKPAIPNVNKYLFKVPNKNLSFKDNNNKGALWFIPASQSLKKEALQDIRWGDLYKNYHGYLLFEELKLQISKKTKSDYLLIDSRTGLTDHSSICTKQFPDLLVSLFFPNDQNIEGLKEITEDVRAFKKKGEGIPILFVGSRIPVGDDEKGIIEEQINKAKKKLNFSSTEIFSDYLPLSHNPSFDLLKQSLLVERQSENIRLKQEYLELTSKIQQMNKNSIPGNIIFISKSEIFLKLTLNYILNDKEEKQSLGKMLSVIDARLNYIFENFPFDENIIISFESLVVGMSELPEHIGALGKFKFLTLLFENRSLFLLYSSLVTFSKNKINYFDVRQQKRFLQRLTRTAYDIFENNKSLDEFLKDSFPDLEWKNSITQEFKNKKYPKVNDFFFKCSESIIKDAVEKRDGNLVSFDPINYLAMNYFLVNSYDKALKIMKDFSIIREENSIFPRVRVRHRMRESPTFSHARYFNSGFSSRNILRAGERFREGRDALPFEVLNFYRNRSPQLFHITTAFYGFVSTDSSYPMREQIDSLLRKISPIRNVFSFEYCVLNTLINWDFENKNGLSMRNTMVCNRAITDYETNQELSYQFFPNNFEDKIEYKIKNLIISCIIFVRLQHKDTYKNEFNDEVSIDKVGIDFVDLENKIGNKNKFKIKSPFDGRSIGWEEILFKYNELMRVTNIKNLCELFSDNLFSNIQDNFFNIKTLDK